MSKYFRARLWTWMLILSMALGTGCAGSKLTQSPQGRFVVEPGFNQFSIEQEIQIGKQAEAETNRKMPLLPDSSPITQYVKSLGQKLAAAAPGEKYPYTFHVVNQKEINAFALPGGPVYVNLGTIQQADESELAGVMAHEIGHVVMRHSTQMASKQMVAQVPLAVLGSVLGGGIGGQLARLGISFAAGSVFMKYSREAETQADLIGSQIMYDAGYNPYAMVEFFQKLEKEGGARGPQFLSDHPNPGNRAQTVSKAVAKFPRKSYPRSDSAEFKRIHADAMKMTPLTAQQVAQREQEQGAAGSMSRPSRQEIEPSGQFQTLNHSAFTISYPSNWKVGGDEKSSVVIAPQAGVAQDAIAYGVMISGFRPQQGRDSLDQATQDLVSSMQQSNPGMKVTGNAREISVNGAPARTVEMTGPSPVRSDRGQALRERDQLVTLQRPDRTVLFLVFIAPEDDLAVVRPAYEEMLRSLNVR